MILLSLMQAVFLVAALSTDAFAAGFAYGNTKIKIPCISTLIISFTSTLLFTLSLICSVLIQDFFPKNIVSVFCFIILFSLGFIKLFNHVIKKYIKKHNLLSFSFHNIHFILHIYANPEQADADKSRFLSPCEALFLGISLSLDGLAAGFGIEFHFPYGLFIPLFSFFFNFFAIRLGEFLGKGMAKRSSIDLSWLGGIILMVLSVTKLL